MKRFAVFVLSHGRAETISTIDTLIRCGYSGEWYVVIDNEDDQEDIYRQKFDKHIIQFDKKSYAEKADLGDLDTDRRIGVLARNFIQDKAKEMGYKYHLQLDDDIHSFSIRFEKGDSLSNYTLSKNKSIDKVFDAILEYMDEVPFVSLSLGSGQYLIGGAGCLNWKKKMIPKTMTTFFMRADNIEYFKMRMNDDITTSALNNSVGKMYYSILPINVTTQDTQTLKGGMTEIYQDNGTYRKSFYTLLALPSCSKITVVTGGRNYRIHHNIVWNNCCPKIISEEWKIKDV